MFPAEQSITADVTSASRSPTEDVTSTVTVGAESFSILENALRESVTVTVAYATIDVVAKQTTVVSLPDGTVDVLYDGDSDSYPIDVSVGVNAVRVTAGGVPLALTVAGDYAPPPSDALVSLSFDPADISTDGASGNYRASIADLSGNSNTAWLYDTTRGITTQFPGFTAGADTLDGGGAYTQCGYATYTEGATPNAVAQWRIPSWKQTELTSLALSDGDFTLSFWFRQPPGINLTTYTRFIFLNNDYYGGRLSLLADSDSMDATVGVGAGNTSFTATIAGTDYTDLLDGEWHHILVRYDQNTSIAIYADGALMQSTEITITGDLYGVGVTGAPTDTQEFNGNINSANVGRSGWPAYFDRVRAYRRAVTPDEIAALYAEPVTYGW